MPSKSKSQQRFMGMVHGVQKGTVDPDDVSDKVKKAAKGMSKKSAKDYASTKHKGLPNKVKKENEMSEIEKFREYIRLEILDVLNEAEGKRKIYVLPGKEAPKGKKVHKGPRGGTFFYGTDQEKQNYETGEEEPIDSPEDDDYVDPYSMFDDDEHPYKNDEEPPEEDEPDPRDVAMEPAEQWLNRYTDEYQGEVDEETAAEFVFDNWEEITGEPYDPEEHEGRFPNEVYDFMEISGLDFDDFAEKFQEYAQSEYNSFTGDEDDYYGEMTSVQNFIDDGNDPEDEQDVADYIISNIHDMTDGEYDVEDLQDGELPEQAYMFAQELGHDPDEMGKRIAHMMDQYGAEEPEDDDYVDPYSMFDDDEHPYKND